MRMVNHWQASLICMVFMAFLMPATWAMDVCDPVLVLVDAGPVDINCQTGDIFLSNAEINLLSNAHVTTSLGSGSIFVDGATANTINIYGGQIDAMLNTTSLDIVTVYGSDFAIDGVLLDPAQNQIVNTGASTYIFNLTGTYEDGSAIDLPCYLESDGVINLGLSQTAPEIDVLPALLAWDLGDVEVGQGTTMMVQIFNLGNADLTVSSVALVGDASFTITAGPATPLVIAPNTSIGVDFEVTFAPTAEGMATATVQIVSDDADESLVEVALAGVGIITEVPPSQQIQDILDLFDASVAEGTMQGYGPGNSAEKRLNALRNMIESASDLINAGDYAQAIEQLESIAKKTDGVSKPQDFAVGEAVAELNAMVEALIAELSV